MLGAIIGDIVGSRFEFSEDDNRGKDFAFFASTCRATDDSFMTIAIAKALFLSKGNLEKLHDYAISCMQEVGRDHINTGWGGGFYKWILSSSPKPYQSYGNGAGMRVSPVGWVSESEQEVKTLSKIVTQVSHDHEEGLKGAECVAMGVYLARIGKTKQEIRERLSEYYPILKDETFTIDSLYGKYGYDDYGNWVTCQGSIPQAIIAFLESDSFENAVRLAVSIGGDSDTIGAMAGSIAEAYYGIPIELEEKALSYLSEDLLTIYYAFNTIKKKRILR